METLRKLGLNKYESEAFVTLTRIGSATAFEISKESGVPYGRIYDSLSKLLVIGMIEVVPGKPKKYVAIPAKKAIFGLIDEKQGELEKLRERAKEEIKKIGRAKKVGEKLVTVTKGKTNFAKRLVEHLETAEKEVLATAECFELPKHYPSLKRYAKKRIKEKILAPLKKEEIKKIKKLLGPEKQIKNFDIHGLKLIISDKELVTISFVEEGVQTNICVKSKVLGIALAKLFQCAWVTAAKKN